MPPRKRGRTCTEGFSDEDYCNNRCDTRPTKATPRLPQRGGARRSAAPPCDAARLRQGGWAGQWEAGDTRDDIQWSPANCALNRPSAADLRSCLRGRRIVMVGDCVMRYQYLSLVHLLEVGEHGPSVVDPQRLEETMDGLAADGRNGSSQPPALPRSISVGFSLARFRRSGKTDYAAFYTRSSAMLRGHEHCDCSGGRGGLGGRIENRHYNHKQLNLSVAFYFLKGMRYAVHGKESGGPRGESGGASRHAWSYRHDIPGFLREQVAPRSPHVLVLNIGIWWFKADYARAALNASWWARTLDAAGAAVAPQHGRVLYRTTTPPSPWRRKDNDGVDQELLRSNGVDAVVRRLVEERAPPAGATAETDTPTTGATFGLFDTFRVAAGFPRTHCHVRGGEGALIKFYTDDMHLQPFVYREFNALLYAIVGCGAG